MTPSPARPSASPRPPRPRVVPDDDFDVLDEAHRAVVAHLGLLAELIERLGRHGVDDRASELARDIAAFFNGHARDHHAEEERRVFPALLADGSDELVKHVRRLQQDHGWLEEDWLELAPQLDAVANGYNGYDLALLQHALPVFTELYREHIALEESLIYPEAKRRLAAEQAAARHRRGEMPPTGTSPP
ncbi:hemerythrin domain-containing protein [Azohydromonas sediminis]|uniref:hemerythrin domain-containing protein n=1 Tax=Azohydromonas sediminis TaxID=2259674 RepID=UPI000E64AFE8|nr:hemerythrin domain-containing protein [Azohydromonas sediminis]